MSFASKHNAIGYKFSFEIPEGFQFQDAKQVTSNKANANKVFTVKGLYINKKGNFGDSPVIITDSFLFNAPSHMVEKVREILQDNESCEMIDKGLVGFKLYEYNNKFGKQFGVEWVDL